MSIKGFFNVRVTIIAAIVAMIALSYASLMRIYGLRDLADRVNHTYVVHVTLERTYSRLRDVDSELNAFLLTRDSLHYTKLLQAEAGIRDQINQLKKLTSDNSVQTTRIISLDSSIQKRYSIIKRIIKNQSDDVNQTLSRIHNGNIDISNQIDILIKEENRLLLQRQESIRTYRLATPILLFSIEILTILFLFRAYNRVASELKAKSKLQKDIQVQIQFIKAILDNSVDVISVFDPQMNLIAANRKANEMFGLTENMVGQNFFKFFPKGKESRSHQALQNAFNGEATHIKKHKPLLTDRILESFFVPLFKDRTVYAAMAIHHDITELVKTSEELELKNQELAKSNEELERFAYVASHDLQEPLRKLRSFANLAENKKNDPEKLSTCLQKITGSAERMTVLINDVLNYSRLETRSVQFGKVDLNIILDQVKGDLELMIYEKNATIESPRLPTVIGSGLQLSQLFLNILSNALKFNIRQPSVTINCESEGDSWAIYFTDNGIGFDPKYEREVFQIFKRLQNRSDYAGTGIGLAVCKQIIQNHKGTIEAHSTPGVGTTFIVRLPKPVENVVALSNENGAINGRI